MKLALRQEESASVLEVQGDIDSRSFAVLKAGLTKLLQNGKNRIVLQIHNGDTLSSEVIRELAILDVFARELSGKLVLVSPDEALKQQVTSFAKPPVVAILPTVPRALQYLKDLDTLEGDEGGENLYELQQELEKAKRENEALKAQLGQARPEEARKAREENLRLKDQLRLLEGQLAELAAERRPPSGADGFLEKIEALEDTVRKLGGEKLAGAKK